MIDLLKYHEYNWAICVGLKKVNFPLGLLYLHAGQPSKRQALDPERVALTRDFGSWYTIYCQWPNRQSRIYHVSFSAHQAEPDETVGQNIKYWRKIFPTQSWFSLLCHLRKSKQVSLMDHRFAHLYVIKTLPERWIIKKGGWGFHLWR